MHSDVAVHAGTGELLEHLDQQPPEVLADALTSIRDRRAQFDEWEAALENELRRRLKTLDRKFTVFGDYEVSIAIPRKSVWDVDELETQIASLVDQGVLSVGETTGVIDRTPTVSAKAATELIRRLSGEPQRLIAATRTWKEQRPRLTVVRSIELVPTAVVEAPPDSVAAPLSTQNAPPAEPPQPSLTLNPRELFA